MPKRYMRVLFLVMLLCASVGTPAYAAPDTHRAAQTERPTLRRESRGPAVRELQRLLNAWIGRTPSANLQPLPITGYFGALTDRTVRTFQRANNLVVDGIVGPRTWAALDVAPPAALAPIVEARSGFVLGGARGGAWVDAQTTAAALRGGETYRLFRLEGPAGTATGTAAEAEEVPCEGTWDIEFREGDLPAKTLAIGGNWNPLPRTPQPISLNSSIYQGAVADYLRAQGISQPDIRLTGLWRVDLDADGTSEVVVNATRQAAESPTDSAAGDYSIVLIRKVVDGAVRTITLASEIHTGAADFNAPLTFTVQSLLDLNGDGRMEIVMDSDYYEGSFVSVHTLDGTRTTERIATGCGV